MLDQNLINFFQETFKTKDFLPLHEPRFIGKEKEYLCDCIDSTFVSSVGKYVDAVQEEFAKYVGAKYAVATVNGTAALHIALVASGLEKGEEVITQALTFVATANAISYAGATPIFVDVDRETLGLSPEALENFLNSETTLDAGRCINKKTGKRIRACVPMHTFGHPARITKIAEICEKHCIDLIEDAAESLGSLYDSKHTGTFGKAGVFSFNGNKIVTSGGGGMIVTDDEKIATLAKHLTTTAKVPHKWEYVHDHIGYNYRMPNLNAALLLAQLEKMDSFLENKRQLALMYKEYFKDKECSFVDEPEKCRSNYWLQAIVLNSINERNQFLEYSNKNGIMTRPIWRLMSELKMFKDAQCDSLENSKWLEERVVNIPSSVRL